MRVLHRKQALNYYTFVTDLVKNNIYADIIDISSK